jgi:phage pi2 protein 07
MKIIKDKYNENDITLEDIKAEYSQTADCTEDNDEPQVIKLETRNNGVAHFYHIKTDGWSFDNVDELVNLVNDFIKRFEC